MKNVRKLPGFLKYRLLTVSEILRRRYKSTSLYTRYVLRKKPEISRDVLLSWFAEGGWIQSLHDDLINSLPAGKTLAPIGKVEVFGCLREYPDDGDADYWGRDPIRNMIMPRGEYLFPASVYRKSIQPDPVVLWEMSRLQQFAAESTFSDYLGREAVQHWLSCNPYPQGLLWQVPLEAALRGLSFLHLYFVADEEHKTVFEDQIWFCLHTLIRTTLKGKTPPNNHRLAELGAMMILMPLFPDTAKLHYRKVCEMFNAEVGNQFTSEGLNAECSSGYHAFSTEVLLVQLRALSGCDYLHRQMKRAGLEVGFVRKVAGSAARVSHFYKKAFCRSPNFGDSSDSRFFPGADILFRQPRDHDYIDVLSDALTFSEYEYEELIVLPRSGSGFFHNDSYGVCMSAATASRISGHAHNDKCSFVLRYTKGEVFVDPGTGMYNCLDDSRKSFRSSLNHNVLVIDGEEQSSRNLYHSFSKITDVDCGMNKIDCSTVEMWHSGYRRSQGVGVVRRILSFSENSVSVQDVVGGSGSHTISIFYILHPDVRIDSGDSLLSELSLNHGEVRLVFPEPVMVHVTVCPYSDSYGRIEETKRIEITLPDIMLPFTFTHEVHVSSSSERIT